MAGTNSEVFTASQIVNSVNKQVAGGRGYQMFYEGWPKLSKKKKRKMAYAAVLQSTAKMASALSTCTQANSQFIETMKRQEEIIKSYEANLTCEKRSQVPNATGSNVKASTPLQFMCKQCGKQFAPTTSYGQPMTTAMLGAMTSEMEGASTADDAAEFHRKFVAANADLEKERSHASELLKQIERQQNEYVELQNQRLESNREQLKVIEYLQAQLQKSNAEIAGLKSELEAFHIEKHNMLNYMSQRLNVAKNDTENWRQLQSSCDETMRAVSDIPQIVNTVQDDIKKLQTQIEIQRQRSDASSNLDPPNEIISPCMPVSCPSNKSTNCNCNNCFIGAYSKCIFSACKTSRNIGSDYGSLGSNRRYTAFTSDNARPSTPVGTIPMPNASDRKTFYANPFEVSESDLRTGSVNNYDRLGVYASGSAHFLTPPGRPKTSLFLGGPLRSRPSYRLTYSASECRLSSSPNQRFNIGNDTSPSMRNSRFDSLWPTALQCGRYGVRRDVFERGNYSDRFRYDPAQMTIRDRLKNMTI